MNVDNLYESLVISNYKEMCYLLGEDVKGGKGKTYQLNKWERYFAYEQQGHKFIIREIYSEPLPKEDNTLYIRFIECLLAYELSTKKEYTNQYTKTNLFYILGMINNLYIEKSRNMVNIPQVDNIPQWQVDNFFLRCNHKLSDILFSALDSMSKRCLLKYYKYYVIIYGDKTSRTADENENKDILRAERDVLKDMGLKRKPFNRMNEFYSKVNSKLNELYGWISVYSEIKLIYNQDQMQDALNELKNDFNHELKKRKMSLNGNIIEAINTQAEQYLQKNRRTNIEKVKKMLEDGDIWLSSDNDIEDFLDSNMKKGFGKRSGIFIYPPDYVDNQRELAELFLRIK